ncbi:M1 family metallopeptidase [Paenibacillus xerothermodurans]|uniref:M1 family peptidase n=1 Tax=Paenibacillus xerothermodurans TaxID=1977292 RepID=A0A2W1N8X5_PAEXE|nr:M1 family metallopeptidase [Paenibacillus xerothermodurans]PZE20110.1 M1 family peptidase [Paenibacillus xerothermodurans]
MKKRLGNRTVQWSVLLLLACGASWASQASLPPAAAIPTESASSRLQQYGGRQPAEQLMAQSLLSAAAMDEPNERQGTAVLAGADGMPNGHGRPTVSAMAGHMDSAAPTQQPAPPLTSPAPPSPPAKPIEKPAPQPLSDRIVEYHLEVELHAEDKRLSGTSTFTWKNPGSVPVRELYFHLYPNAFNSEKTTFMKESGGRLRNDKSTAASVGGMDITSIKTRNGQELSSRMEFVQPDDGNKEDRTLMKLTLPAPVNPGDRITLNCAYDVKLPAVFARMGYAGDFVMAGQWFPKLAVYEPAGLRGRTAEGWNLHQYHGNSEFYADFGLYDVRIKVPADYTVAATGFPIKPATQDGQTKTYTFYADDVHDFAWAASPHFIYYEEPYATSHLPGVRIKLYLDPKHDHLKQRYMTAAKKALARYSQWYGSYPYSTLSIVIPPENGNGAGGMEYPTLVTGWGAAEEQPDLELERVIVHEIAHQFWYGIVANNEFEEAWLDEGFASYAEDKFMELEYDVRPNLAIEASYITSPRPLQLNSWSYGQHGEYAGNVYTRSKLVLKSIESEIGTELMSRVLKAYFQKWKFGHPTTADFQKVLENTTNTSWSHFFDQYIYNGHMVDYAVGGIQTRQVLADGKQAYENTVLVQKKDGTYHDIPIRFHFADGSQLDKTWDGKNEAVQFKLNHPAQLDWVVIDPEKTIILENKRINSFMKTNVDPTLTARWNMGVVKFMETLCNWVAW